MSNQKTPSQLFSSTAHRRRWEFIFLLMVALLFLVVLSTLLPIWSHDSDSTTYLPVDLHAKATADYAKYPIGTFYPAVSLRIIKPVLLHENPFARDLEPRIATMTHEIGMPVPTSTVVLSADQSTALAATSSLSSLIAPPAATAESTATALILPSATITGSPLPTSTGAISTSTAASATSTPTAGTGTPVETPSQAGVCQTYPSSGFVAAQDTWIDASKPDSSNEKAPKLQVEPGSKTKWTLMQFDLTDIPLGSAVESATLYLEVTKTSTYTVYIYRILDPWSENVTWKSRPSYEDIIPRSSFTLDASSKCLVISLDAILIENWVNYPDQNFGIVMIAAGGTGMTEYTGRDPNPAQQRAPKLVVTYVP